MINLNQDAPKAQEMVAACALVAVFSGIVGSGIIMLTLTPGHSNKPEDGRI